MLSRSRCNFGTSKTCSLTSSNFWSCITSSACSQIRIVVSRSWRTICSDKLTKLISWFQGNSFSLVIGFASVLSRPWSTSFAFWISLRSSKCCANILSNIDWILARARRNRVHSHWASSKSSAKSFILYIVLMFTNSWRVVSSRSNFCSCLRIYAKWGTSLYPKCSASCLWASINTILSWTWGACAFAHKATCSDSPSYRNTLVSECSWQTVRSWSWSFSFLCVLCSATFWNTAKTYYIRNLRLLTYENAGDLSIAFQLY